MARLPRVADLTPDVAGNGFFLCLRRESRTTRRGDAWFSMVLQDASGQVLGRLENGERFQDQFDAGEFVHVEARAQSYNGRVELLISSIRRVYPDGDRAHGFREEDCLPVAPRSIDEMWQELGALVAGVGDSGIRVLLQRIVTENEARLRIWPAAVTVHHAYRGGLLEHILQVANVGRQIAQAYEANSDLVVAGAVLHDIGKLREIEYDITASYSREGNLLGHIAIGLGMVRAAAAGLAGLPEATLGEIEHLVASHHGKKEHGSPAEPMTVEAFILAAADDLDAKLHQVRRAIADDQSEGEFTPYHTRLKRVFLKP